MDYPHESDHRATAIPVTVASCRGLGACSGTPANTVAGNRPPTAENRNAAGIFMAISTSGENIAKAQADMVQSAVIISRIRGTRR